MSPDLGTEVEIDLIDGSADYVGEPLVVAEVSGVGRIEVGTPDWSDLPDVPQELIDQDRIRVAVVEPDGGIAASLHLRDEPGVLASVPGQPDDEVNDVSYVVWAPLPDRIDIVAFKSGRLRCWQRPVSGIAAFPWPAGYSSDFLLVGLDSAGKEQIREQHDLAYLAGDPTSSD